MGRTWAERTHEAAGILVQRPALDASYQGLQQATVRIADPVEPAPILAAFVAGARRSERVDACIAALEAVPVDGMGLTGWG